MVAPLPVLWAPRAGPTAGAAGFLPAAVRSGPACARAAGRPGPGASTPAVFFSTTPTDLSGVRAAAAGPAVALPGGVPAEVDSCCILAPMSSRMTSCSPRARNSALARFDRGLQQD